MTNPAARYKSEKKKKKLDESVSSHKVILTGQVFLASLENRHYVNTLESL